MLIGKTILADDAAATTVYSPWFPRRGNAATFVLEVLVASTATVTVTMQTKNSEDPDPGTTATGGTIVQTGAGTKENCNENLKELVRYKFDVSVTQSATEGFAHYRMLEPAWETN